MINQTKIAQIVKNRWSMQRNTMSPAFERNTTYTEMYESILRFDDAYPWDYKYVEPVIFQLLRTMMSRLNPENSRVSLLSRNSKVSQFRSKNQKVINWELSEMNKTMVFYNAILRGLIAGRSYISTGWHNQPATKIKTDIPGKDEFIFKDIMNRAVAKNVRFDDLIVGNLNDPNIDTQPYIIERIAMRFGDMLDDNKNDEFWVKKELDKIKAGKVFLSEIPEGYALNDEASSGMLNEEMYYRSQYVGLLKMTTLDGEVIYTLSEREGRDSVLNKNTTNEYWHGHYPYLSFAPFPMDDKFLSQGIVQPLEDLAVAISSSLNQFMTNARKAGNPMWISGSSAAQTPDWMFVNRPDGIIRVVGDTNQIRQAPINDTSALMSNLRNELSTVFEKSSSIASLYSSGVSGSSSQVNKTATGAKVIDANIDMNMQMLISLFGAQLLSGIGSHFLELNAQYITEEQEVRIDGSRESGFIKIRPEEVSANFDVVANPDNITKVSPVVRQASLLNLKATIDSEKNVQIDSKPIWKAILSSYPEIEEIDEDIIIDPEVQAENAIGAIERGITPVTTWNQNHKAIKKIVQFHMISNQDAISDEQLVMFTKYVDELTKWIDADKQIISMEQAENPALLPTNQDNIEQSVLQSTDPVKNMPQNIALQEAGQL